MAILLVSGSPTIPSRSARLLQAYGKQLNQLGHETATLAVRDLPAHALVLADRADADIASALALIAHSDAIVFATPVYKAAYSGLLKIFLDLLPQDGLRAKIIQPLATGGSQSHMLALDYALRPVLASLNARQILPSIYATDEQIHSIEIAGEESTRLDSDLSNRIQDGAHHLAQSLFALQKHQSQTRPQSDSNARIFDHAKSFIH